MCERSSVAMTEGESMRSVRVLAVFRILSSRGVCHTVGQAYTTGAGCLR